MAKKSAAELLKEIEDKEREAYAEFERTQKDKREKALSGIIDPLRKERSDLATTINEANVRISEIDRELAKLTGKTAPAGKSGGGKRTRFNDEQIAEIAAVFGKQVKSKFGTKNEFAKKDALGLLDAKLKNHLPRLIEAWNKSEVGKGNKIGTNGKEKAASRYLMH